jgi:hypothetical protein
MKTPAYKFAFLDRVRVKRPGLLGRFFGGRAGKLFYGLDGDVAICEFGKQTSKPLYTIVFEDGEVQSFFENELELVAAAAAVDSELSEQAAAEAGAPLEPKMVLPGPRSRPSEFAERSS